MKKISIIIPCYNEERYIAQCLESILASDYPSDHMEILVVDGGSTDRTVQIVQRLQKEESCIRLCHNPKRIAPAGMNIGIKEATGEYIFILSAHAEYADDYFKKLVEKIAFYQADCTGGVLQTQVKHKTPTSLAIKEVLSHPFGVGNASFRTGSTEDRSVDTVAFGCYDKNVFERYGYFDESLVRNQDIELNKRIINGGGKIYLIPDAKAIYYARENLEALAKNSYANGYWNILTAFYTKKLSSLSARHFVPLAFVLSLIVPLFAAIWVGGAAWIALLSLLSYFSLVIITSIQVKQYTEISLWHLVQAFGTLHLAYGIGSLAGLFKVIKLKWKGYR